MMHEVRCVIHNVVYGYEETPPGIPYVECPACSWDTRNELKKQLKEITEQRDLLLQAIDLKRLSVTVSEPEVHRE